MGKVVLIFDSVNQHYPARTVTKLLKANKPNILKVTLSKNNAFNRKHEKAILYLFFTQKIAIMVKTETCILRFRHKRFNLEKPKKADIAFGSEWRSQKFLAI